MIKHIAGMILFSFIVGVGVFISAVTESSVPVTVSHEYKLTKKKKKKRKRHHCDRSFRGEKEISLDTAVFEKSSGLFSTTVVPEYRGTESGLDVHFYANDRFGPRFLKTEQFSYNGDRSVYMKELRWMKFLDPDQQVFVIPTQNDGWSDETIAPSFDSSKAVPVLIKD